MAASRIQRDAKHVFECFLEVAKSEGENLKPFILQSFPSNYKDKEANNLQSVPNFTFPCKLDISNVENFSFVLTDIGSQWTFGFCRVAPNSQTALVFLSKLPWHETFYKMLNHAAELVAYHSQDELYRFLHASHTVKVPDPGQMLHINWLTDKDTTAEFKASTPHHLNLPRIPENRNLTEYYNAIKLNEMIIMFASLLHERRIIVTSKRLSRLSSCVQAANALLYPMFWQHIFIPVLPYNLIDYLSAPMPFLIGVPAPVMQRVKTHEIGEVVILDADQGTIFTPFDDVNNLPGEVKDALKRGLKKEPLIGEAVSRAFLSAIVHIIGGYRDALKLREGESITFCEDAFLASRPVHMTAFLRQILELQLFRQFVDERLALLNSGNSHSDEFEFEVLKYSDQSPHSVKFKSQAAQLKRDGGAFVKAVQKKANPAVKNAVRTVRESSKSMQSKGRSAIKDIRSRLPNDAKRSQLRSYHPNDDESKSAPSSPTNSNGSRFSSGSSGIVRTNTESNFKARILKYEKFEPPQVSSLSSLNIDTSPTEIEDLPKLDMNLLPEMHDVIYNKSSSLPNQQQQQHQHPPKVNRQLKPPLKRASVSDTDFVMHSNSSVASNELKHSADHPYISRQLANPPGNSPELDLIALGETSNAKFDDEDDIIFDPLLEKESKSTHRPLTRAAIPTSNLLPVNNTTSVNSKSTDDLLREYGLLEFSKLSLTSQQQPPVNMANFGLVNQFQAGPVMNNNIFDDLYPFGSSMHNNLSGASAVPRPTMAPPAPPMAPPRSKRVSQTQNWTTFD